MTSSLRRATVLATSAALLALPLAATTTEADAATYHYKNCTALHQHFKHGVGKKGAKDKTSGTPVTTFKRSTTIYKKAIAYNKRLDADKDGIACEKR